MLIQFLTAIHIGSYTAQVHLFGIAMSNNMACLVFKESCIKLSSKPASNTKLSKVLCCDIVTQNSRNKHTANMKRTSMKRCRHIIAIHLYVTNSIAKSWKQCDKRSCCLFWAFSPFCYKVFNLRYMRYRASRGKRVYLKYQEHIGYYEFKCIQTISIAF